MNRDQISELKEEKKFFKDELKSNKKELSQAADIPSIQNLRKMLRRTKVNIWNTFIN